MSQLLLPSEIKPLFSLIENLGRKHNYATVFDDYLSCLVNFFTPPNQDGMGTDCFKKYSNQERIVFSDLIKETIAVYQKMITKDQQWYDPFGELYMFISSHWKSKALGQFFTPAPVVDLMVRMNHNDDLTGKGLRVNDPTCGSGRMLIAFHVLHPGNYVFGEDLDLICCKMSLINCLMHGCEGEIVWHDSLKRDFRKAWRVNPTIRKTGLPILLEIQQKDSVICQQPMVKAKAPVKLPSESKVFSTGGNQLVLF